MLGSLAWGKPAPLGDFPDRATLAEEKLRDLQSTRVRQNSQTFGRLLPSLQGELRSAGGSGVCVLGADSRRWRTRLCHVFLLREYVEKLRYVNI